MRYWKFSQKTKLKQKFFANSEKEVGTFFKTGTTVLFASHLENKESQRDQIDSLVPKMILKQNI